MNSLAGFPAAFVSEYERQRAALLEAYPELAEDGEALTDTLDGATLLPDLIANIIRQSREDEAMADALTGIIKAMQDRRSRLEGRSDKRRSMAMALMEAANMPKLTRPDFTASVRNGPAKVIVTDGAAIPDQFCRISRLPNLSDIRQALNSNVIIPGVTLGNGERSLSVRVK